MTTHNRKEIPSTFGRALDRRVLFARTGAAIAGGLLLRPGNSLAQATPGTGHQALPLPSSHGVGAAGLSSLLAAVPAAMLDRKQGSGIHWYYADIAQQFAALNLTHDIDGWDLNEEPWVPALYALAAASTAFQYSLSPDFTDAIGFVPIGVDQTLLVGDPPEQLTLFRAPFDPDRLQAAWNATGYTRETSADGLPFWTIGRDGEFSLTSPVQRVMIAAFNNLALLEDDLLVCAPTADLLEQAIATYASGEGSAALDPVLGMSLYTLPETTVSAIALTPALLEHASMLAEDEQVADSDATVGPMPEVPGMIFGVTAGAVMLGDDADPADYPYEEPDPDNGEGLALVRMVTTSAADAEQAIAVVDYRWNSMVSLVSREPLADLMEIKSSSVDGNVAQIDFVQLKSSVTWFNLVIMRDLLAFLPAAPGAV